MIGVAGKADPIPAEGAVHQRLAIARFRFALGKDLEDAGVISQMLPHPDIDIRVSRGKLRREPVDARHQNACEQEVRENKYPPRSES
jgi:hypothetical protein